MIGLNDILKMLDIGYPELKDVVSDKLEGLSKSEKKLVFDFLCRNEAILLRFLSGDMSLEEAVRLAVKAQMGFENTAMDFQVGRFSADLEDDNDCINACFLGGMLLIVALLQMEKNQSKSTSPERNLLKNKMGL